MPANLSLARASYMAKSSVHGVGNRPPPQTGRMTVVQREEGGRDWKWLCNVLWGHLKIRQHLVIISMFLFYEEGAEREEEEWRTCAPFLLRATLRGWTHPIGHTLVIWSHLAAREPGRCGLWLTCTQPKLLRDHRETDVKPKPPQLWTYKAHKAMVEWTLRIRKEPRSSLGHHGTDIF